MSLSVVNAIVELLRQNITPLVPLRGSISASGDLMPLSYVAGAIQGNPDVLVRTVSPKEQEDIISAQTALEKKGLSPIVLGPKEGLSIINGTAPSAAVASLAFYDAQRLAMLSQLLTALTSEVPAANVEWAHLFHCGSPAPWWANRGSTDHPHFPLGIQAHQRFRDGEGSIHCGFGPGALYAS